jgi:hypothetical protein
MRPTVAGSIIVKVRQVIGRNSIFYRKCCTTDIFEQYGIKEIKVILELAGGGESRLNNCCSIEDFQTVE